MFGYLKTQKHNFVLIKDLPNKNIYKVLEAEREKKSNYYSLKNYTPKIVFIQIYFLSLLDWESQYLYFC